MTGMGQIHRRLEDHGLQGSLAIPELDIANYRQVLEAAHAFMTDEEQRTGFLYSGWCQTALPHKRLPDDQIWTVRTDHLRLMIEPGSIARGHDEAVRVGVPYGSKARLILLHLQSEAVRTKSREIELGKSLRVWLGRLGVPIGGQSMGEVRQQAIRISRCRMTFQIEGANGTGFSSQNLVDTSMFSHDDGSSGLMGSVTLSEGFFKSLMRHPVPLQEAAIRSISNNSQALDIYCWLAYRLHVLDRATPITWKGLHAQFGSSYRLLKHFRPRFIESLHLALGVYPEAEVAISETGIILLPSRPPVPARIR